ncbi:MAG: hypothetical protein L0099_01390, partial [Acidobacteria bacterium]|nr:hypothetical protein [Acidobacteriota bacterium]
AIHVEAASAYLGQAAAEAERRGHGGRVTFIHADFVAAATTLAATDIVTLDRVVCCYPDYERLLELAAAKCRQALVLSYPRARWAARVAVGTANFMRRLLGSSFRVFVHPPSRIAAVLERAGLERVGARRTLVWEVAAYRRPDAG